MFSKMVILIPVYNPRERIINYVKKLKEKNYDVIVINDGSDENYHAVFERMVYDCKIINYPHFKGKGYARETLGYAEELLINQFKTPAVTLGTAQEHPWLPKMYESFGFKAYDKVHFRGKQHTTILFKKDLL